MTEPRSKTETLSETCKTFLKTWLIERIYEQKKEFYSRETAKGNAVEDPAIMFAGSVFDDLLFCEKNEKKYENEYLTGTPDIVTETCIADIKNSFTPFTFPFFETEQPEKGYDWQLLGYMNLTGVKCGSLVYCLMDMPEELVLKETRIKYGYQFTEAQFEEVRAAHTYSHLPDFLRIKRFNVPYDHEKIKAVHARVIQCREYINQVLWPKVLSAKDSIKDFS